MGYLLGYPSYLEQVDENLEGVIRRVLFDATFGPDRGREYFQESLVQFLSRDGQVCQGRDAGEMDGTSFFRSLEAREDATGALDKLKMAFKLGLADIAQQIST